MYLKKCVTLLSMLGLCSVVSAGTAPLLDDRERLEPQWRAMDKNGDGKVAMTELHPLFAMAAARSDFDNDGFLSLDEYVSFDLDPGGAERLPLANNVQLIKDIAYAGSDDPRQQLDLYLPETASVDGPLPVIAYIHGGGWKQGSRIMAKTQLMPLVASGKYAAISVGYRLSWQSTWPAQIHDVKAAIRWIKANAKTHGLDASRVCAMGASAGGHLAAMLGTSNAVPVLEGELGSNLDYSSDVHCAIDFFGPADLRQEDNQTVDTVVSQLLGGPAADNPGLASQASPVAHVDANDVPFMIIHGTSDPLVSYNNSVMLADALREAGVPVYFQTVQGGTHGDFGAARDELDRRIEAFLQQQFYSASVPVETDDLTYKK